MGCTYEDGVLLRGAGRLIEGGEVEEEGLDVAKPYERDSQHCNPCARWVGLRAEEAVHAASGECAEQKELTDARSESVRAEGRCGALCGAFCGGAACISARMSARQAACEVERRRTSPGDSQP